MTTERQHSSTGPRDISSPAVRSRLNAIAHDFNNLLTVVIGYSELLLKQLPEGDVREQVSEIRGAGSLAAQLNDELLSIVRPATGDGTCATNGPGGQATGSPPPMPQVPGRD